MDSTNPATEQPTSTEPVQTGGQVAETTQSPQVPAQTQSTQAPQGNTEPTKTGTDAIPPLYQPNYKFKSMGKEHEIDEWLRPHIKDQETEKKVKELYEKAYGLDHFKTKHETSNKELEQIKPAYQSLYNEVSEVMTYKNSGDLDMFFEKVNLKPEKVYEWVLSKLERQNLPPEQRRVYDELDAKKRAEYQTSRQMSESEVRYQQIATQAREAEVNYVLARPEINEIVRNYDAKHGENSFKQFVAEYGVMHFNAYGEDPSAETAISAVLKRLGDAYKSQPAPMQAPTANAEKPLPVIPNVSGKNISPTRKSIKSIDDIKKIAAEMNA